MWEKVIFVYVYKVKSTPNQIKSEIQYPATATNSHAVWGCPVFLSVIPVRELLRRTRTQVKTEIFGF